MSDDRIREAIKSSHPDLSDLVDALADKLTEQERSDIKRVIWAGEETVAIELICEILRERQLRLSSPVLAALLNQCQSWSVHRSYWQDLGSAPVE